ncbi:MAG: NAD(P)-binding protein, partial [Bacteroidota bacterium]|nr:NAD(P)-binding protein [Bacteroidota bacterium]
MYDYLIVGAGFSGAALAERLSRNLKCRMLVIDARNHIGGNCRTERDESTGVMIHKYGPHIFHTDKKEIWDYVNQFDRFMPFINRVKAVHNGEVYSLPVNLHTINQFFRRSFTPGEAQEFIRSLSAKDIAEPKNFEEQALKFIGRELYESFFYGYTKKQWGCEPRELPASILKRLPVRFNYNDNYYDHPYQGIPQNGYTYVIEKMLAQPQVEVRLNTPFNPNEHVQKFRHIFFTGALDSFFNFKYGRLSYRTIFFERHEAAGDYQGNAVINYVDETVPFTRIHEHKHFAPWEQHER